MGFLVMYLALLGYDRGPRLVKSASKSVGLERLWVN